LRGRARRAGAAIDAHHVVEIERKGPYCVPLPATCVIWDTITRAEGTYV
jgi:hypothetical protein